MNRKDIRKKFANFGGRFDAVKIADIDGMHFIMPQIFPGRCNNEGYISETVDLSNVEAYLEKKNSENPEFKYTFFHLIVTALLRTIYQRPKMNRFIKRNRVYQRKRLTAAFVVKKQFSDSSSEGIAFIEAKKDSTLDSIHESIRKQVMETRHGEGDQSSNMMDAFATKIPGFISRTLVQIIRAVDSMGWLPDFLIGTDCYQASVLLSNLGSIKLKGGYHHLANWGTNSIFVTVGERKKRPFFNEDGTFAMKDSVTLGFTIDERLADGYYYAKTVRLLKYLIEHPELLDEPIAKKVAYEKAE